MSGEDRQFNLPSFGQAANFVELTVYGWVLSIEVFLRSHFGSRYIGAQGATVLLLVPVYAMFWEKSHDVRPLFLFLLAYLGLCLSHRLTMFWRTRNGEDVHSRYTGKSHMQFKKVHISEVAVKKYVDPLVAIIGGLEICWIWNVPLGVYVMIGGVLMHLSVVLQQRSIRQRSRDLNDSFIDHQQVSEQFRDLRGDQF